MGLKLLRVMSFASRELWLAWPMWLPGDRLLMTLHYRIRGRWLVKEPHGSRWFG